VRSAINSRSNSASAAKIPKNSRPFAVVVSICAPAPALAPGLVHCCFLTTLDHVLAPAKKGKKIDPSARQEIYLLL
jgi:hypothetical protein